jgi:hypothetical protein
MIIQAHWDGQGLWPASGWEELRKLPVNGPALIVRIEQPRSPKHHKRTFALISAAYRNWPKHHEFRPQSSDELRAWLVTKAGKEFRLSRHFPLPEVITPKAMAAFASLVIAEMSRHEFSFLRTGESSVAVYWPKSMSWSKMDQKEFAPLAQAIAEIIETETGIKETALLPPRVKEIA